MIGIKDMEMPSSCEVCKIKYVDECGDFYICGITHNVVQETYNEERIIEHDCPLIEIVEGEVK